MEPAKDSSFLDVLTAAGIEKDVRGAYPVKEQRNCQHWGQLFSAVDSALRVKDKEIGRLRDELAKAYQDNSKQAAKNATLIESNAKLGMEKVRIGLEANPHISEQERMRICS